MGRLARVGSNSQGMIESMKRNFTKAFSASILTLSMAILPLSLPAFAQNTGSGGAGDTGNNNAATSDTTTSNNNNRDFDWGWLGLLGLFGLAGLRGKGGTEEASRYRDPNVVGSTTYRD